MLVNKETKAGMQSGGERDVSAGGITRCQYYQWSILRRKWDNWWSYPASSGFLADNGIRMFMNQLKNVVCVGLAMAGIKHN